MAQENIKKVRDPGWPRTQWRTAGGTLTCDCPCAPPRTRWPPAARRAQQQCHIAAFGIGIDRLTAALPHCQRIVVKVERFVVPRTVTDRGPWAAMGQ